MPHITCAHCGTPITDHSYVSRARGADLLMPILDGSTQVERDGQTFCCTNCATAMAHGAGYS